MRVPGSLVLPFLLLPFGAAASGDDGAHDWRKSAPIEEKVERLVEVMPGASNLMLEMGDRYRNLYWAARQGKWDFAAYQAEEIEQLIETLKITRPKRAATAAEFQARAYPRILDAAKSGDWPVFEKAYEDLRGACMACHVQNDHAFVVLPVAPVSAPSPVLNMQ
jgi:hypothetical protein